jgi:hypothetical protein
METTSPVLPEWENTTTRSSGADASERGAHLRGDDARLAHPRRDDPPAAALHTRDLLDRLQHRGRDGNVLHRELLRF